MREFRQEKLKNEQLGVPRLSPRHLFLCPVLRNVDRRASVEFSEALEQAAQSFWSGPGRMPARENLPGPAKRRPRERSSSVTAYSIPPWPMS